MFLPAKNSNTPKSRLPRNCSFVPADWHILASYWHPVAWSTNVTDHPVGARLLDIPLVLWRSHGHVHAAKDLCMHRGAQLSMGAIRDGLLVCPLHGFHYDGSGACRKIPALSADAPIPVKLRLESYLCEERYGMIWVCLDEQPAAPIPEWPHIESGSGNLARVRGTWRASAARHVENFNDLCHIPFVHQGTFGGAEDRVIEPYDVSVGDLTLSFQAEYHEKVRYAEKTEGELPLRHRRYIYRLSLPFSSYLQLYDVTNDTTFRVYDVASPVSATVSEIFQILIDDTGQIDPAAMVEFQSRINAEDAPLIEAQSPLELPLDLRDEIHTPADRMSIEYRRSLVRLGLGAETILGTKAPASI
ncbi:aromatic ring-hydroxylating oxygenase subunit alpha [Microvirga lotononidis]|uniref:Ring-hydroxylating dioxygenase, large terminal subunit n=1 Tax=Microvirga lotononidis TaxID=864069 RepID=I4YSQ9_9HYPH|nr:aromatic ring-hydroxylating dioxygenase subunit alpha [Microvirga lotononidis]EIM27001.1 ring-hydroxylating dioxygenase, large terminal subunit [Microvirga lotononidis]WQO28806.1 aromatic ring-hydroxylating dioxygenase subunit alpha [Microvirga lotononidis]